MATNYTEHFRNNVRSAGASLAVAPAFASTAPSIDCSSLIRTTGFRAACFAVIFVLCALAAILPSAFGQNSVPTAATIIEALQKGNNDDAVRMAGELLRTEPKSPKLWTLRGIALEHSNHPQDALKSYHEALKFAPNYLPALEGAAQLEYRAQSKAAVPLLRRILAIQPADQTTHAMLGVLEYRDRNYAKAAEDFEAGGDLAKSQPSALMAYALCLAHLNREAEAIPVLQQLLVVRPDDSVARYDLALVQWRVSKHAEALSTLQPILESKPPDAAALRLAAAIHEANGETPQAVELLRSAILANPDEPGSYLDFAALSFAHNSYTVGIDIVNAGLTRLPDSPSLYMARGVLYGQNGDFEKAMADFEHAHQLDPTTSMAASAEGIAQSQQHNHKEALENFRQQVREHPNDALGYYLLAEALSWSGSEGGSPDNQKNIAEAIANAEKSNALDPKLVQVYDLLASLYLQNDQIQPAIDTCRAALKMAPKDQSALYTLILALRKTGAKEELKDLVQRLMDLRKEEQASNSQKTHYGMLVEEPSNADNKE